MLLQNALCYNIATILSVVVDDHEEEERNSVWKRQEFVLARHQTS